MLRMRALAAAALLLGTVSACARSERHVVEISGFAYNPPSVQVQVGDTIEFVNRDVVPHTATSGDGSWDSGQLSAQESWSWIAAERGVGSYVCALHPSMTGRIDVR